MLCPKLKECFTYPFDLFHVVILERALENVPKREGPLSVTFIMGLFSLPVEPVDERSWLPIGLGSENISKAVFD